MVPLDRSDMTSWDGEPNVVRQDQPWKACQVLISNLAIISGAVWNRESRLAFGRVLRTTASVRNHFTAKMLHYFIDQNLNSSTTKTQLMGYLERVGPVRLRLNEFRDNN